MRPSPSSPRCRRGFFCGERRLPRGPASPQSRISAHLFCNVLKNRLLILRTHVGEIDSVALLISPRHDADDVNGYARQGSRNDNWATSFGFKSLTST